MQDRDTVCDPRAGLPASSRSETALEKGAGAMPGPPLIEGAAQGTGGGMKRAIGRFRPVLEKEAHGALGPVGRVLLVRKHGVLGTTLWMEGSCYVWVQLRIIWTCQLSCAWRRM